MHFPIIVSACLCGFPCRYDGASSLHPGLRNMVDTGLAIPVCPEELGGLETPRTPCEIYCGRVVDAEGYDKTEAFALGAAETLRIALEHGARIAVLKERSPSCGSKEIYDGTFTGTRISGLGITAALLRENGIRVFSEETLAENPSLGLDFLK